MKRKAKESTKCQDNVDNGPFIVNFV